MGNYIRFDWAMKRLLRDKANFQVLEGLLTTLLNEKITIKNLLESESNQEEEYDKYNRVDMPCGYAGGKLKRKPNPDRSAEQQRICLLPKNAFRNIKTCNRIHKQRRRIRQGKKNIQYKYSLFHSRTREGHCLSWKD